MSSQVSGSSMTYLKDELDLTLDRVQQSLEVYSEYPDSDAELTLAGEYLSQVAGVLVMLDATEGAKFARELADLAVSLQTGELRDPQSAREALLQESLKLEPYLDRIRRSPRRETESDLIQSADRIRVLLGKKPVGEQSGAALIGDSETVHRVLIRKLRPDYQHALACVFRGQEVAEQLSQMARVLSQLADMSREPHAYRLWWVCGRLIEGLRLEQLDLSPRVLRLLGGVDRAIKRLIDAGEDGCVDEDALGFMSELEAEVRSTPEGERLLAERADYHPPGEALSTAPHALVRPDADTLREVASNLADDISVLQDAVDRLARGASAGQVDMADVAARLHRAAAVLSMLNMNSSANLLQRQHERLQENSELDREAMERLVADLLLVETSLSALMDPALCASGASDETNFDSPTAQLQAIRHHQARMAATEQAIHDIEQVLELTQQLSAGSAEPSWEFLGPPLHRVANVFSILGHQEACEVSERLRQLVANEEVSRQLLDEAKHLSALAEAMVAIEYFLKAEYGVEARNPRYLSHAQDRLSQLEMLSPSVQSARMGMMADIVEETGGTDAETPVAVELNDALNESTDPASTESRTETEELLYLSPEPESEHLSVVDTVLEVEDPEVDGPIDLDPLIIQDESVNGEAAQRQQPLAATNDTLDPDGLEGDELFEALEALNLEKDNKDQGDDPCPDPDMDPDVDSDPGGNPSGTDGDQSVELADLDPGTEISGSEAAEASWLQHEFLEVFLEEAVGEIEQLRISVPEWIETPDRVEVLATIRRSFHTLKGSGRMVGAEKAGEFAWGLEEMLNRVLDGRLLASPALRELVSESVAAFADLIAEMQQGREAVDLQSVSARVTEFLDGGVAAGAEPDEPDVSMQTGPEVETYPASEIAISTVNPILEGMAAPCDQDSPDEANEANEVEQADEANEANEADQVEEIEQAEQAEEADEAVSETVSTPPASTPTPQVEVALDSELAEIFVQEAADILDSSDVILERWSRESDNPDLLADLRREMHTLKGSSRMAGFLVIGDLAHAVESLLDDISRGRSQFVPAVGEVLQRTLDRFHDMLAVARKLEQPDAARDLVAALVDREALNREPTEPQPELATEPERAEPEQPKLEPTAEPPRSAVADAVMLVPDAADMVRVGVDLLDKLADQMGESSIYRARIAQNVGRFDQQLKEMDHTVGRLSEKLRRLEIETEAQILFRYERGSDGDFEDFDPLELDRFSELQQLSRSLMEVVNDLNSIRSTLGDQTQELDSLLHQQAKVNHEIQEGLTRTRMVRFDSIVPRMRRVVRQAADELGKRAELVLVGSSEMERGLLEHVVAPLEHILRNAVSHGIEDPAERVEKGKRETGRIVLDLRREGSELVMDISDDGAGINFDGVRRKAEKVGFLQAGEPTSKDQLIELLLMPGFSTADCLTQVSGRGVGMDIVNEAVKGLGGSLAVESEHGKGAKFSIRLPFSLSITKALMVNAGGETYAVPLAGIEAMTRITSEELRTYADKGSAELIYGDRSYSIRSLGALLGGSAPQGDDLERQLPAMLVQSEGVNVAFQIDAVVGSDEAIVKSAGPQINSVPGLAGATILGDGRVVLILEMAALVRNFVMRSTQAEAEALQRARLDSEDAKLQVMVIDDSITMRKVTSRLLERQGVEPLLAKDGLDAAGQLEDVVPDAVVLDIEMPRMDGFELAAHIRNQEHLWHLPIIMVTSRSGDKHRQRAMELGVNEYLGKPYREEELVASLQRVLGDKAVRLAG